MTRADCHRDRSFDGLHDVSERDLRSVPRQGEAASRTANTGQQALRGQAAHELLGGRQGHTGLQRELTRAKARASLPASGSGHDHDRIIGEMGQAHIKSDYLRLI